MAGRTFVVVVALALAGCGGGGSSAPGPPAVVVTPTPTPAPPSGSPGSSVAYTCPTSTLAASSRQATSAVTTAARPVRRATSLPAVSGWFAVTYDRSVALTGTRDIAGFEQAQGAQLVRALDFPHAGVVVHVVAIPAAQAAAAVAALRAQPGVRSVAPTGGRRVPFAVTQPVFPNDPYFNGFTAAQNALAGNEVASTFHVGPYDESQRVPGQWDMHAIGLEHAFGYAAASNGSGIVNPSALGASAVTVAVIDSGADTTHPELAAKVAYHKCFITSPSGVASTSDFSTDRDGHGTNVSGIAAGATGNALGFTGTGGNVVLYAYRIFPTPDDNCTNTTTTDPQCSSSTVDVASAIQDAVAHGARVINLSFGGDSCNGGQDPDALEGTAIADALAANVIVVAAAGNSGSAPVNAPACDAGVIAVGASALADGPSNPNGTGNSLGSPTAPVEYVASYSNFGTPGAGVRNPSAWGIVAPGGDPSGMSDTDDLHWIDHIWTSTPVDAKFAGACVGDYPTGSGPTDCRILIAGTSQASPHVAGAAALIVSVNPSYQSSTRMKTLLCGTADDIGDQHEGCGRLNVYRAMAVALGDPSPP